MGRVLVGVAIGLLIGATGSFAQGWIAGWMNSKQWQEGAAAGLPSPLSELSLGYAEGVIDTVNFLGSGQQNVAGLRNAIHECALQRHFVAAADFFTFLRIALPQQPNPNVQAANAILLALEQCR